MTTARRILEHHAVVAVDSCSPEDVEKTVMRVSRLVREGAYRIRIKLKGLEMKDCLELVRRLTQTFIHVGFIVEEE